MNGWSMQNIIPDICILVFDWEISRLESSLFEGFDGNVVLGPTDEVSNNFVNCYENTARIISSKLLST